jgi:hypothetical protein
MTNHRLPRRHDQNGSIMVVLMVLTLGFGAIVTAHLTKVVSQDREVAQRLYAMQAETMANSQLELAKNIVNASPYDVNMQNEVLVDALGEANQVIPGTAVRVERVTGTNYFVLRTTAAHRGIAKAAESIVRQSSPASSYNLFVIDHGVGLCGSPRGAIHTNKFIDFYFPDGFYRDQVTASEGFNFTAGASAYNTRFAGVTNPAAPAYDILASVDFASLASKADVLSVTDPNLVAEVEFQGDKTQVKLFRPGHFEMQDRTRTVSVLDRWETQTYTEPEPIYATETYVATVPVYGDESYVEVTQVPVYAWRDATRTVTEDVYENQRVDYTVSVPVWSTRTAQRQVNRAVWVPYDGTTNASSGGGTVGSSGAAAGYWRWELVTEDYEENYISGYRDETRTRTERVRTGTRTYDETYQEQYVERYDEVSTTRTRQVVTGTQDVTRTRQVVTGWQEVTKTRSVPIYVNQTQTYKKKVWVAETLERTETVDSNGVVFLRGDVRKMQGRLDGRMSLIAGGAVKITDSIQYVDGDGNTRMANGLDKSKPYEDNPGYQGNSLLAVMAEGDILYAKDAPKQLEVNASLISAKGTVSFEGIVVSDDGRNVSTSLDSDSAYVKDSIRRLGGIVSRRRPVATYIDEWGWITAGFENGESIMDQNLILSSGTNAPPPFMFEAAQPTWIISSVGTRLGAVRT